MYRILVVPGDSGNLDLSAELHRLSTLGARFDNIYIDLLPEGITEIALVDRLSISTQGYDALHLMGHADDEGFYLSDGSTITAASLKSICRESCARTVFINSCVSARIGQYLVNNGVAVAICYAIPVIDKDAIINAVRFYSALAKSNDPFEDGLREAYQVADPGDGSLLWLTNGEYTAQIIRPIKMMVAELGDKLLGVDKKHDTTFEGFKGSLKNLEDRFFSSAKHTRYIVIALIAVIMMATIVMAWAAVSYGESLAQTIPPLSPVPTKNGTIPPAASPENPTRKPTHTKRPKPTNAPASPVPPTKKPTRTKSPSAADTRVPPQLTPVIETSTPIPTDTRKPTSKPRPTSTMTLPTPWVTPSATFTYSPSTATHIPQPVITSSPTHIIIPSSTPTATLTDFEKAVHDAVMATVESWCTC